MEKARKARGEGSFREVPGKNGLIEHRVSRGFDTEGRRIVLRVYGRNKAECVNRMAAAIEKAKRDGGVRVSDHKTIGSWLTAWLARKQPAVASATYMQYESAVRLHIEPHLGRVRLDRLSVGAVDAWLAALDASGVGSRAQQYARMVLGNAMRDAMRLELVSRNVVSLVHAPEHRAEEFEVWEVDEARAFLAAARECRYSAFWTLWLTTGARPHELLGLRPEDVDLDAGEITITKQLRRSGTRGRLKTETSRRTLRIPPVAIEALRAHRERMLAEGQRASEWVFPAAPRRNRAGKIVANQQPRHTDYRNLIAEHYETIVAAARVSGKDGKEKPLKRIRPYDLRHTAATLALKAGVPIKVVSEALGHASIALTQGTYQHVLPSMREEHVDRVQALFGPSKTG